ncbi:amidohydrolase family protein [Pseudonocardia sp. H11422]|uniref:amidohydrolase family protein n=1 Tax=Pseudonocardia sp. H11422 TaxID=2835866 RepID=UPI001BDC6C17|nr:amidohydrolase family protein [Pseudonocardia sp. H11422]
MPDLIDVHAHHYPQSYLDACRREDSGFDSYVRDDGRLVVLQDGAVALAAPQPMPTLDQRLTAMDEAGVEVQVLSISAPNVYRFPARWRASLTRDLNDELHDLSTASGSRLKTFISLPLPDVEASLRELDRALGLPGSVGVMITTTVDRRTLDDPHFLPLLEALSDRRCVVLVHPTTACCTEGIRDYALALGLDFLAETTNCIARLVYSGRFEQFAGIDWIFSHLGGTTPFLIHRFDNYYQQFPECRQHIERPPSEILRRAYFDTVTTNVPALRCALDTFDPGQFVFGTDYPHVPGGLARFTSTLQEAGLTDADSAAIGHVTASRLLGVRTHS